MHITVIKHDIAHLPAEWESQWGVMLMWPDVTTDWRSYLGDITSFYISLVDIISKCEHVVIASNDVVATEATLSNVLSTEQIERINVYPVSINDTWARDVGPISYIGQRGDVQLLNFRFNGWGGRYPCDNDNFVTERLFQLNAFNQIGATIVDNRDFVLEGGSIETDGNRTIFTTRHCLLSPSRNAPLKKINIEEELKRRLHVNRIVWINHGALDGDDTDGHIDNLVRTAPNDTLLYTVCAKNDDHYNELKAMENDLHDLLTPQGRAYRLLPLPLPAPVYDDDQRLPASYANFLVINNAVIMPSFNQPDNDSEARHILAEAFPNREILSIDARTALRQRGGIHCLTMPVTAPQPLPE